VQEHPGEHSDCDDKLRQKHNDDDHDDDQHTDDSSDDDTPLELIKCGGSALASYKVCHTLLLLCLLLLYHHYQQQQYYYHDIKGAA